MVSGYSTGVNNTSEILPLCPRIFNPLKGFSVALAKVLFPNLGPTDPGLQNKNWCHPTTEKRDSIT